MDNLINQSTDFGGADPGSSNLLMQYVNAMEPEAIARLSQPASADVLQMMERKVVGLLGSLPSEQFGVMVTTSREGLGRLLASAMLNGYFLRAAEQRMSFEQVLSQESGAPSEDGGLD